MLKTRLTTLLGIDAPIIQAPIGPTAEATLALAVTQAGGLGTLAARAAHPDELRRDIRHIREKTTRSFGVGFITHLLGPCPATSMSRWKSAFPSCCSPSAIPRRLFRRSASPAPR